MITRTCTVSGKKFEITTEDQKLYEKIGIPAPTLCSDERNRRRMCWRNDRVFYRRKCDLTGKSIISIYPEKTTFPVYEHNSWWKGDWDPYSFGQNYDFSRDFFSQWQELMHKVPRRSLDTVNCENSDYCNYCGDDKNCYLDIAGEGNEDCYFNLFTKYSRNCADNTFVYRSELVYESINCNKCFDCRWSMYLDNCNTCDFCYDCKGCSDCVFCWNLRRKKYCIFNEQLTKEEFFKRKKELLTSSNKHRNFYYRKFREMLQNSSVHKYMQIINGENCDGNNIQNSKNTHFAFNVADCWDSSFLYDVLEATDCRDLNYSLYKPECSVELISTLSMKYCFACMGTHFSHNMMYCDHCENSHDCFGCIGLNHGKYCIFNKQYSKEEYLKLREKIIAHMKKTEEWGEFFPIEISPHAYNETVAQEYFPLTKEEATQRGFDWKDKISRDFRPTTIENIPDDIADVEDSICQEVLACETCTKNYQIQKAELNFYRKMNLPIPRKCPDCRHADRMKMRNPRTLFARNCAECGVDIQTTFSPERPEKVLCEDCYLKIVN
jgi:hypothetical protein